MRWIDRLNERAELMGRMMETIGALNAAPHGMLAASELRLAAHRCLNCRQAEECLSWLDTHAGGADAAPDLCPNAALFADWKTRL
ncbi:DUF6455 family protein [Polymorphum gilvum]|uniref:DUF6455 domain-containing protein n=1 Tax=Polymorphum gilvum (strain LMG 25793 / CGMCC 1.9160 / SL003B-26A1) TaxID=991905 RepID=F2J491_POLGS|nr:DUF6455 family protein [Polymorphum gilvum]ADZ71033.1 hypothetical protein SL003B_2610 [Polymorphum gilvum SL003B-26A1]